MGVLNLFSLENQQYRAFDIRLSIPAHWNADQPDTALLKIRRYS
jgi:hypothetical protein